MKNPRRAYDKNGNEIPPVTVGASRAQGENTIAAFCEALDCGHDAIVSLDGLPDDLPVPDIALRLRCSKCGGRKIKVMVDVVAMYQLHREKFGF